MENGGFSPDCEGPQGRGSHPLLGRLVGFRGACTQPLGNEAQQGLQLTLHRPANCACPRGGGKDRTACTPPPPRPAGLTGGGRLPSAPHPPPTQSLLLRTLPSFGCTSCLSALCGPSCGTCVCGMLFKTVVISTALAGVRDVAFYTHMSCTGPGGRNRAGTASAFPGRGSLRGTRGKHQVTRSLRSKGPDPPHCPGERGDGPGQAGSSLLRLPR